MGDLSVLAKVDYLDRVNRAIDHITRHLSAPLRLDDVAGVACFSPHHFHRIFRAITGETLHGFVTRVRFERALYVMSHGGRVRSPTSPSSAAWARARTSRAAAASTSEPHRGRSTSNATAATGATT